MTIAQLALAALGCLLLLVWLIGRRNRKQDPGWRIGRSEHGWWKEPEPKQDPPDDGPEGDY